MQNIPPPLQHDLHLADYQRRVEENLRLYRLFHAEGSYTDAKLSSRWLTRWGAVSAALQLLWAVAYGFVRYKS
jgi:hypothetical protein